MNNPNSETLCWLRYAREDMEEAEAMVNREDFIPRHACWLSQQAAEKSIKAILVYKQIEFPRRHDLDALLALLPSNWRVKAFSDLSELTEWSVESRYPGNWSDASSDEAIAAVRQAKSVYEAVVLDFIKLGVLSPK
jgi:HEPN domain-containing protein